MGDNERRIAPRLARVDGLTVREIAFPVGSKTAFEVEMSDVSEGGVGFRSPVAFALGTTLEATFNLPGWSRHTKALNRFREEERPLTAVASVTRCLSLPGGVYDVGVRFTDIWEDHWRAMRLHIEEQLSDQK